MKVLYLFFLCLCLCGCLGVANAPQQQPAAEPITIQIKEVQQRDFTDKEPRKHISWVMAICLAGTLFLVPVIMLKGTRL